MIDKNKIREEADHFFEWPESAPHRLTVSTTSAILFAEYIAEKATKEMREAIEKTIEENLHLADGEVCTLIHLKRAIGYDENGGE